MPERIQLSRLPGWRKPEGAIVVARPSRWGNPFHVGYPVTQDDAVRMYREFLTTGQATHVTSAGTPYQVTHRLTRWPGSRPAPTLDEVREQLAGHDLACWCALTDPCHADVLLELAAGGSE